MPSSTASGNLPPPAPYGTRLSTVLLVRSNGQVLFIERDIWKLGDGVGGSGSDGSGGGSRPVKSDPPTERKYNFQLDIKQSAQGHWLSFFFLLLYTISYGIRDKYKKKEKKRKKRKRNPSRNWYEWIRRLFWPSVKKVYVYIIRGRKAEEQDSICWALITKISMEGVVLHVH